MALFLAIGLVTWFSFDQLLRPASTPRSIPESISAGTGFLSGLYSPEWLFNDPYILNIDQLPGTNTSLRMLDIATIVTFFLPGKLRGAEEVDAIVVRSQEILMENLVRFQNAPFDREAIDLYGIFPYFYPNQTSSMLAEIVANMDSEGNWEPYDRWGPGFEWRKITDESWLILAMARNRVEWDVVEVAIERKAAEARKVLDGSFEVSTTGRYYALAHLHLSFVWTAQEGYDLSKYADLVSAIEAQLARVVDDSYLLRWTAIQAETLYWLCSAKAGDTSTLEQLARLVLDRQMPNGGWRFSTLQVGETTPSGLTITERNIDSAVSHTTLVAITALSCYQDLNGG